MEQMYRTTKNHPELGKGVYIARGAGRLFFTQITKLFICDRDIDDWLILGWTTKVTLKKWRYSTSSSSIWSSFDSGEVEAVDREEAFMLASRKLTKDFNRVNEILRMYDGDAESFSVHFAKSTIEIEVI